MLGPRVNLEVGVEEDNSLWDSGFESAALDEKERQAMRAFLQRAEVRLSTMHRIAGAFLNGAGLLLLFPVFFGQAIKDILRAFVGICKVDYVYYKLTHELGDALPLLAAFLLLIPFCLSLYIPLYAMYNLLKDIIHFYFAGHSPGFSNRLVHPRFVLTGIAFSPDESINVKTEVYRRQYQSDLVNFIIPFDEAKCDYFDKVRRDTNGIIIPYTRTTSAVTDTIASDVLNPDVKTRIDRFNTALGLAGVVDRSLVEEVAKMETSLVRHALCLRRLVLRYAKALLAFIWTTLVSFVLIPFTDLADLLIVFAIGYSIWSILTPIVLSWPLKWIKQYSSQDAGTKAVDNDDQLVSFEKRVKVVCGVSLLVSLAALTSSLMSLVF